MEPSFFLENASLGKVALRGRVPTQKSFQNEGFSPCPNHMLDVIMNKISHLCNVSSWTFVMFKESTLGLKRETILSSNKASPKSIYLELTCPYSISPTGLDFFFQASQAEAPFSDWEFYFLPIDRVETSVVIVPAPKKLPVLFLNPITSYGWNLKKIIGSMQGDCQVWLRSKWVGHLWTYKNHSNY